MPYSVYYDGKRYATNATPLQKLRVLVEQVFRQVKGQQSSFNGQLYINGVKADLDMPLRFANLSSNARLEVKTDLPSRLGVQTNGASSSAERPPRPDTLNPQSGVQQAAPNQFLALPRETPSRADSSSEASSSQAQASALTARNDSAKAASPQNESLSSKFGILGLDREVAVFSRAALEATPPERSNDLPDSFYEFGTADFALVMRGYSNSKAEAEKGLRTAKMREDDERARARQYPKTAIRIAYSDGFYLQMEFNSLEKVAAIKKSVQACLLPGVKKWHLYVTPPKQVLSNESLTLFQAGLCPAAKLYFSCENEAPFLRPEILALQGEPPEADGERQQSQKSRTVEEGASSGPADLPVRASRPANGEKKVPKWMKVARK